MHNFQFSLLKSGVLCLALTAPVSGVIAQDTGEIQEYENFTEEQTVIPPLFEYVIAPDDLPDLQSRTDYLMDHFWDPFDFKNTKVVDQNALNHAFGVYVQAMPYASDKKVESSVKSLIKNIRNNPGLSYQFARAAEENLYGPRAEIWGDEIYIDFLKNLADNKKIRDSQKRHFSSQLNLLESNRLGAPMPKLQVSNIHGSSMMLNPTKEFALIEFLPPESDEASYSNLKMDISALVNDLLDDGRLEVDVVILDNTVPHDEFPDKWNLYCNPDAKSFVDIRRSPSFFVLDKDGKIAGKNLHIDEAISLLEILSAEK